MSHVVVVPPRSAAKPLPSRPLTLRELAQRWQCHPESLRRAVRRGDLIAFQPGLRRYRVTPQEIARVEHLRGAA